MGRRKEIERFCVRVISDEDLNGQHCATCFSYAREQVSAAVPAHVKNLFSDASRV